MNPIVTKLLWTVYILSCINLVTWNLTIDDLSRSKWLKYTQNGSKLDFLDQILLSINCSGELWHKASFVGNLANLFMWQPSWILLNFFISQ